MNRNKKLIALLLCIALMLTAFAGCGKQETPADPAPVDTEVPGDAETEDPAGQEGEGTDVEAAPPIEGPYADFLLDEWPVTVACNAEGLENGQEYTISEIARTFAEYLTYEDNEFFIDTVSYGYIDCGSDGNEELALSMYFGSADGFQDYEKLMAIKDFGGEYRLIADTYTAYRVESFINRNGFITYGGSSSASSYYQEYSYIDAAGDRVFLYSCSYNFGLEEPVIPSYELPSDIPSELADYGLDFADNGYEMDIYNFQEYDYDLWDEEGYDDNYRRGNIFVFTDPDGNDVMPEAKLLDLYNKAGVEICSSGELNEMLNMHYKECGFIDDIENGSPVSWKELDSEEIDWMPKG